MRKMLRSFSVAMVAVGSLAAGTGVYAQEAPEPRASSGDSGEIVVTAQRREERLQDVPLSISAVSGDALEKAGTSNIAGLATFTPSLTYAEFNASAPNTYIPGLGPPFHQIGKASCRERRLP